MRVTCTSETINAQNTEVGGNTIPPPGRTRLDMVDTRHRSYALTIFDSQESITFENIEAKYKIFGVETCPTTGRQHGQSYIQFENAKTFKQMKKSFPTAHIEVAKGSPEQNRKYCAKDGAFKEWGEVPKQGKRSDLDRLLELAKENASWETVVREVGGAAYRNKKHYHEMLADHCTHQNEAKEVIIITGPTGCGKTRWAHETFGHDMYMSFDFKWWDGYTNQETILVDDFSGTAGITWLLRLCDRYPMRVQIKGGTTPWLPRRIIFTSNVKPEDWFPDALQVHKDAFARRVTRVVNMWDENWVQTSTMNT